jgi:hypothetical protein
LCIPRFRLLFALIAAAGGLIGAGTEAARGGAWLMPPGDGQVIADTFFSDSTQAFGTTMGGGPFDFGTVFKLKPPAPGQTQWTETVLLGFGSPTAGLNIDSKDPLHGGVIPTPCLSPPSLPSIPLAPVEWASPEVWASLVSSGVVGVVNAVYGTTNMGGTCSKGAVFQLTPPAPGSTQWTETENCMAFTTRPTAMRPLPA